MAVRLSIWCACAVAAVEASASPMAAATGAATAASAAATAAAAAFVSPMSASELRATSGYRTLTISNHIDSRDRAQLLTARGLFGHASRNWGPVGDTLGTSVRRTSLLFDYMYTVNNSINGAAATTRENG